MLSVLAVGIKLGKFCLSCRYPIKQFDNALTLSSNANFKGIVRVGVD
jgi:hypothetical protein